MEKNPTALKSNTGEKVVIPVVFHVVYNENQVATEKIPYEKMVEQVEVMNRDFNRHNRDKSRTRAIFDSIAGSADIVFALATADPDGNPTKGVTYTSTKFRGFDITNVNSNYTRIDSLKSTTGGGRSAWPTDRYFNVWVAHLTYGGSDGLYGIATFPTSMPANEVAGQAPSPSRFEGVAMFYQTIALSTTAAGDTLFAGRTLTHEVGHFLGLRHIWGDTQSGLCDSSDYVFDTPQAKANANFVCNLTTNECTNENTYWTGKNPPNMVENYMDYSGDLCYNMFSNGQVTRMHSFLNTDRKGLWQNGNAGGKDVTEFKAWGYTDPVSGCSEDCDGKIELVAQKGMEPYLYTLDGFACSNKISDVCSGLHSITIRDAANQVVRFDLVVGEGNYKAPKYTKGKTNATCYNCPDGKGKVTISNGRQPMTVTWLVTPVVTGPQITGCKPGVYKFTITDGCGKQYTDSVTVGSPNGTGIAALEPSEFIMYPNPATNELNISFNEAVELSEVRMVNVVGSLVSTISINSRTEDLKISVADLPSGVYAIELIDNNNSRKTLQFIKQ